MSQIKQRQWRGRDVSPRCGQDLWQGKEAGGGHSPIARYVSLPLSISLAQHESRDDTSWQAGWKVYFLGKPEDGYEKGFCKTLSISVISDIWAETTKMRWKSVQDRKNPTWKSYKLGENSLAYLTKRMSLCLAHNKQGENTLRWIRRGWREPGHLGCGKFWELWEAFKRF